MASKLEVIAQKNSTARPFQKNGIELNSRIFQKSAWTLPCHFRHTFGNILPNFKTLMNAEELQVGEWTPTDAERCRTCGNMYRVLASVGARGPLYDDAAHVDLAQHSDKAA